MIEILKYTFKLAATLVKGPLPPKMTLENWFWTCVILTIPSFYSSYIFAKIVARPVFVVETLEDVVKLPEIEIVLWKDSAFGSKVVCPKIAKDFPFLAFQINSNFKLIKDLPKKELNSVESLNDVLDGNRIVFQQTVMISQTLSNRVKNKKRCGFFVGKTHYSNLMSMLFNKNLKIEIKNVVNFK